MWLQEGESRSGVLVYDFAGVDRLRSSAGLRIYGADGTLRARLFNGREISYLARVGNHAYVFLGDDEEVRVVDVSRRSVVGTASRRQMTDTRLLAPMP